MSSVDMTKINSLIGTFFKGTYGDFVVVDYEIRKVKEKDSFRERPFFKIKFVDYDYETFAEKGKIIQGKIFNPLFPNKNGYYLGIGKFNKKDYPRIYSIWSKFGVKASGKDFNAYKDILICEEWHNYQNFANWYTNNTYDLNLELDKDILYNINHLEKKIYSPNTCILIPEEINRWLAGDNEKSGVLVRNGKFSAIKRENGSSKIIGKGESFKEAKRIYGIYKYQKWIELLNKYPNLPKDIKSLLLKYDFTWYWKFD